MNLERLEYVKERYTERLRITTKCLQGNKFAQVKVNDTEIFPIGQDELQLLSEFYKAELAYLDNLISYIDPEDMPTLI